MSLTIYCSGFFPSDSLTIMLDTFAGSTWNQFVVSGSLIKKASPNLKTLRTILNMRVSKLLDLVHCCKYCSNTFISLPVPFVLKSKVNAVLF